MPSSSTPKVFLLGISAWSPRSSWWVQNRPGRRLRVCRYTTGSDHDTSTLHTDLSCDRSRRAAKLTNLFHKGSRSKPPTHLRV
ncbi:hypothetical protein J6590_020581 [Homalodisca vitripennis]|nr:hypothetical protein J6590_020581 [Homalodisca vitripennis]